MAESTDWQPIETAPRDQHIEAKLPNGDICQPVKWSPGGGWCSKVPSRYVHLGWIMFNDHHQPVAWRPIP